MTAYPTPATLRSPLPRLELQRPHARLDAALVKLHAKPRQFGIQR